MDEKKLRDSDLFKLLEEKSNGILSAEIVNLFSKVEPILERISDRFKEFTDHSIRHSLTLLNILNWLIPEECKNILTKYDLFALLASCALHDIGMSVNKEYEEKYKKSDFYNNFYNSKKIEDENLTDEEIFREFIRQNHHKYSRDIIDNGFTFDNKTVYIMNNNIEDQHSLSEYIGILSESHGYSISDFKNNYKFSYPIGASGECLNLGFLATCLRISDYLHITKDRTPTLIFNFVHPENRKSFSEWCKHLSIIGIGPKNNEILVNAECTNPQIHFSLESLLNSINNELISCREYLSEVPQEKDHKFYIPFHKIVSDIKPKKEFDINTGEFIELYKPVRYKFSLSSKEIFEFFMGERLYTDNTICLRELLQNAVDAIRVWNLMSYHSSKWKPKILIKRYQDIYGQDYISFSDNGIGMDEHIVNEYLCKIGKSYYGSTEFKKELNKNRENLVEKEKFIPISEFGIGILSCFMIADKIAIDTTKYNSSPLLVEIHNQYDFFIIRKGKRKNKEYGTTVILTLSKNFTDEIRNNNWIIDKVSYYARHIEFPIEVEDEVIRTKKIIEQNIKPLKRFSNSDLIIFKSEEDHGIQGYIACSHSMKNEHINLISQNGILVPGESWSSQYRNILPFWLSGYKDLNLTGKACLPLTTSRDFLLETKNNKKSFLNNYISKKVVTYINDKYETIYNKKRTFLKKYNIAKEINDKFFYSLIFNHEMYDNLKEIIGLFDFMPYIVIWKNKKRVVSLNFLLQMQTSYNLVIGIYKDYQEDDYSKLIHIAEAEYLKNNGLPIVSGIILPVIENIDRIKELCGVDVEISKDFLSPFDICYKYVEPSNFIKRMDFAYFHAQCLLSKIQNICKKIKMVNNIEYYFVKHIQIDKEEYNERQKMMLKSLFKASIISLVEYKNMFIDIPKADLEKDIAYLIKEAIIIKHEQKDQVYFKLKI